VGDLLKRFFPGPLSPLKSIERRGAGGRGPVAVRTSAFARTSPSEKETHVGSIVVPRDVGSDKGTVVGWLSTGIASAGTDMRRTSRASWVAASTGRGLRNQMNIEQFVTGYRGSRDEIGISPLNLHCWLASRYQSRLNGTE
jgi:hypothetical protein